MSSPNVDELVQVYLSIRNARDELKAKYEEEDALLKVDIQQIESVLLDTCNSVGANSINTVHGTVMRRTSERFYCNDWSNFSDFVKDRGLVHLLEKRIHQGNFKLYLDEVHAEEGLPPGVNVMREFTISVRKPSKENV
jgi:hypothetical protein